MPTSHCLCQDAPAPRARSCALFGKFLRECSPPFDPARVAGSKVFPFSSHAVRVRGTTPSRRARGQKDRPPVRHRLPSRAGGGIAPPSAPVRYQEIGAAPSSPFGILVKRRISFGLYAVLVRAGPCRRSGCRVGGLEVPPSTPATTAGALIPGRASALANYRDVASEDASKKGGSM